MRFKPKVWYPIAAVLSAVNVASVWFAAIPGEPLHATVHAALAVAFGVWAERLRRRRRGEEGEDRDERLEAGLEAHAFELDRLRQELSEASERLDFAERMLAQRSDPQRVEPR